jgi:HEAT repeat protein
MHLLAALALLVAGQDVDAARLRELVGRLGADFLDEREEARKAIEAMGAPAEKILIESLGHADPRVRRGCLLLLVKLSSATAKPRAAALFREDEDPGVVDAAFLLLRGLGKGAEDELVAALASPSAEHRAGALETLGEMKSAKAAPHIDALEAGDPVADLREKAYEVLLRLGPPAEPALLKRLDAPEAGRRLRAFIGLKDSKSPEVLEAVGKRFALETEKDAIDAAYDILRGAGPASEGAFRAALTSLQERARERAVDGLRGLKAAGAIEPVGELFRKDPAEPVRRAAGEYLKAQGLRAEDALIAGLKAEMPAVRLEAIRALGEIKAEKPLGEISRLFREDKDRETHRAAFEYLRRLGGKAEKDLMFALDDEDKAGIRIPAIQALGAAKSAAAIERLIDFLGGVDPETKEPARDALVRIGPKALAAVEAAVTSGRLKKPAAEEIRDFLDREAVEELLAAQVTDEGGTGWYEGQFKELVAFGKVRAMPVLLRMLREPAYPWRLAERREKVPEYDRLLRELAVMALGELGDPVAAGPLKAALAEQPAAGGSGTLKEEILVALHRLGDVQPVQEFLDKATKEADALLAGGGRRGEACSIYFSEGLVLNRVGRRADAAAVYLKIVKASEGAAAEAGEIDFLGNALYNLACLSALDKKPAEAVDWLGKAVRAGFRDREWIRRDKDLDAIREEAAYKALLADDALFEKGDK